MNLIIGGKIKLGMSNHRSSNNYLTKLDLEFTIARHLDNENIRVYVTIFKYRLASVWIRPYPIVKNENLIIIDLKSVDNKLEIKSKYGQQYLQGIMQIEDDILEMINSYEDYCCLCCSR